MIAAAIFLIVAIVTSAGVAQDGGYLSPLTIAASKDGKVLYIAEATAGRVAVFDVDAGAVTGRVPIGGHPSGLALAPDGSLLYVSDASPRGVVHIVDVAKAEKVGTISVGHTPVALTVSPDGETLYVCNQFDNDVSVVDLPAKQVVARIGVEREPVAVVLTPDGKSLFVANLLPNGAADKGYAASVVSVIDTASRKVTSTIQLPNGSTSLRGMCVSPDGKHVYVTHIVARFHLPTTQLERGWMNTNALSILDAGRRRLLNTVLLDEVDLGAANPWGVACSADGRWICVAHAGTHELSVIDRPALHNRLEQLQQGRAVSPVSRTPEDVPTDLAFLLGLRRRLKLAGAGPRGLAVVGAKVYAAEYYSDSVGVVDVNPDVVHRPKSLALGPRPPLTKVRKGEMLFHDATMTFQQWQSCASCHPGAARTDGLNWDLLNDGLGNPRSTKNLLLVHSTPPAMITGVRASAEVAVRAGIVHTLFAERPEEDAQAIDAYLKSLKPVASPRLVNGELSQSARRGEQVFKTANCIFCHPPPLYTDLQMHKAGTGKGNDKNRAFDTPTLVEVWRTGPYLYDGRAATMEEVISTFNESDEHGATSSLSEEQIRDLVEFVLSL